MVCVVVVEVAGSEEVTTPWLFVSIAEAPAIVAEAWSPDRESLSSAGILGFSFPSAWVLLLSDILETKMKTTRMKEEKRIEGLRLQVIRESIPISKTSQNYALLPI